MPKIPGFVGPAYRSQSLTAAADRCVNLIPESLENSGEVKATAALFPAPGLASFTALPGSDVSALFELNGRTFAVVGNHFFWILDANRYVDYGPIATGGPMPTIAANGTSGGAGGSQLMLVSGGRGYILDLSAGPFDPGAFQEITDANFPTGEAAVVRFIDTYFAVLRQGTTEWRISQSLNGLVWPGADVAQRSFAMDHIVNLAVSHREVWLLGSQTSEVWYNAAATFPFAPIPGVFIECGCAAVNSVQNMDGTLYWLAQTKNGGRFVVRAEGGYQPKRISTHAIEFAINGYETISDATSYTYEEDGHSFYVLSFPSAGTSWVFDSTTGLWHERGAWDSTTGNYTALRQQCHCYGFGKHLVGDRLSGTVFEQNIRLTSDGGGVIRRQRTFPHLTDELRWTFYDEATLDLETGLGIPAGQGSDPQVMLRWSNDGGRLYSAERWVSAGAQGDYGRRARWVRLGRGRDRVFEVAMSDPIPWRLSNLYLKATMQRP